MNLIATMRSFWVWYKRSERWGMEMDYGSLPQWVTAGIASAAGIIALVNMYSQRTTARKRAAFDIFLKTETDEKMLTAYDNFHKGVIAMGNAPNAAAFCTSATTRDEYLSIRKYLNVHELVAVGIKEKVLDPDVCYSYWGDTLTSNFNEAKPVLDFLETRPKNKYTYADLRKLNAEWVARKAAAA
ncbi:hypothetical protein ACVMHZ_009548 [Bradyrhizobium liaoningense]